MSETSGCSDTLPMPGVCVHVVAPRAVVAKWHPWPENSWYVDSLVCCEPREDRAARFMSLGAILDRLELDSIGQVFNLACMFEEEAWSLGVWYEHTEIHEWVQKQSPSFVEGLLRFKAGRITEFQREMEVREAELAELFIEYPDG